MVAVPFVRKCWGLAMNETVHFIARHGYWLLVIAVLGKKASLPIPSALFILAAGALAHSGRLSLYGVIGLSVMTFLLADLTWYEVRRTSGDRMLNFVYGLSRDPEACINKVTAARGAAAVARWRSLVFDTFRATLWTVAFTALGYMFSDQFDLVAARLMRMGVPVALAVITGFGFLLVRRFARWRSFASQFRTGQITPEQLRE